MGPLDIDRYKEWYRSNPSAFVEGAHSFCKQAERRYGETAWDVLKPLLVLMAVGYGGMKLGSWWGRYAHATNNPNGPIKGPILNLLETALPNNESFVYKGTPEYEDLMTYRARKATDAQG